MPNICAATSDLDTYKKLICRKNILYLDQPFFGNSHFSDKIPPKVREEKERWTQCQRGVSSAWSRCLSQGLVPAPRGIRATLWLSVARATCTRTLYDPFDWPFGRAPRTKGDLQQLKAL